VHTTAAPSLRDAPMGRGAFDIVSASYALSDVVRETMTMRQEVGGAEERLWRPRREALAENRLKRTVKDLWSRVAPGGMLVVVEHGTLAGFETVLFARDTILQLGTNAKQMGEVADSREDAVLADAVLSDETASSIQMIDEEGDVGSASGAEEEKDASLLGARVVAPCLHSEACPLQGTATRARVCRFIQRLNRPLFLRNTMRRPTGHEDTVFSYIVIERPNATSAAAEAGTVHEEYEDGYWGRLVREPLRRGKHVVMDACTAEGKLERRVSSKKNGAPGMYAIARKVRWGDVWPQPAPASKPQEVMF
jgi:ribosomal protein RSM22 (predicted rRNA methylase)